VVLFLRFWNPFGGWSFIFWFNWVLIVFTAIFGFGFGGYSSVKAFIDAANTFGVFAPCYNC
jgi:auxin influx carrier (AUX1 LAX family)